MKVSIYIQIGLVFILLLSLLLYNKKQDSLKRIEIIKNFPSYVTVLNYHLERAYEIIHKDRILIYSLEATRLTNAQFDAVTKDFINLVLKFLGPKLIEDYSYAYGNFDTFLFNITEYFNTRYEEDEIRKESIKSLMEGEIETEEKPEESTQVQS